MRQQRVQGSVYDALALETGRGLPPAVRAYEGLTEEPTSAIAALVEYLESELDPKSRDTWLSVPDKWALFDRIFGAAEDQVGLPRNLIIRLVYRACVPRSYYVEDDTRGGRRVKVTPDRDYSTISRYVYPYLHQIREAAIRMASVTNISECAPVVRA